MTNRKRGVAAYDNDQQRRVAGAADEASYEKGSTMERGTAHEFATEDLSQVGAKDLNIEDPPPSAAGPGTQPANPGPAGQE